MDATTDDKHDYEAIPSLIMDASRHRLIVEACMDGTYDPGKAYRLLGIYRCKADHLLSLGGTLG
jgi:hypothetical protein